jgi:hypothetical protein
MTTTMTPEILAAHLAQFTGTETWYRHGMCRHVLYTEGVQYVAEHAGAYWLVDLIAIAQRHSRRVAAAPFQVWTLKRAKGKNSAVARGEDSDGHCLCRQCIPFTDFPLEAITLYCAADRGERIIMLVSEY